MAEVELDRVSKVYPDGTPAASDLQLRVADGEFLGRVGAVGVRQGHCASLGGRSRGCDLGRMLVDGRVVTECRRVTGTWRWSSRATPSIPTSPSSRTLASASSYARSPRWRPSGERRRRRGSWVSTIFSIASHNLSGGQRQRVANGQGQRPRAAGVAHGRAAVQPERQLRVQMRTEIAVIQRISA
jgi:hypothetical protein